MTDTIQSQTPDQTFIVKEKLAMLEEALNQNLPGISTALRDIHTVLKKDPDVVTILTEEEVSVLVRGLKKQTNTEIAVSAIKTGTKKSLKKLTVNDL